MISRDLGRILTDLSADFNRIARDLAGLHGIWSRAPSPLPMANPIYWETPNKTPTKPPKIPYKTPTKKPLQNPPKNPYKTPNRANDSFQSRNHWCNACYLLLQRPRSGCREGRSAPVLRIAATTLASDSAITIARFHLSPKEPHHSKNTTDSK